MLGSSTELRTAVGTFGYEAPDARRYIDVDGEDDDTSHVYTYAVDIWSLGCVVYQMRARQLPFPNSRQLRRFSDGKALFPTEPLAEHMTPSGVEFLQKLPASVASLLPTAKEVLKAAWLYSGDVSPIDTNSNREFLPALHSTTAGPISLQQSQPRSSPPQTLQQLGSNRRESLDAKPCSKGTAMHQTVGNGHETVVQKDEPDAFSKFDTADNGEQIIIGLDFSTTFSSIAFILPESEIFDPQSITDWPELPKVHTVASYSSGISIVSLVAMQLNTRVWTN
jgi:serine/threonine protein kinase